MQPCFLPFLYHVYFFHYLIGVCFVWCLLVLEGKKLKETTVAEEGSLETTAVTTKLSVIADKAAEKTEGEVLEMAN